MLWILLTPSLALASEPSLHLEIAKGSRTDAEVDVALPASLEATVVEGARFTWTVLAYPKEADGTAAVCFGVVKGEAGVDATPRVSACLELVEGEAMSTQTTDRGLTVQADLSWTGAEG